MSSKARLAAALWCHIKAESATTLGLFDIAVELANTYGNKQVSYIPSYELERIFDNLGVNKEVAWRPAVDLFCSRCRILSLRFQLVDGDAVYALTFEDMQDVMEGKGLQFDSVVYEAGAAEDLIFPYFVPTKRFFILASEMARVGT